MADIEKKIWGIHTYDEALFLKDDKMAIGWKEIGNLREIPANRDDFKKKYVQVYPDASKGAVATCAGMLYRFCHEVQIGDYVVYPSKSDRMINIGEITGDYEFVPDAHEYVQQRNVMWLKHIPRTSFSQGALYEIGSALSFFAV